MAKRRWRKLRFVGESLGRAQSRANRYAGEPPIEIAGDIAAEFMYHLRSEDEARRLIHHVVPREEDWPRAAVVVRPKHAGHPILDVADSMGLKTGLLEEQGEVEIMIDVQAPDPVVSHGDFGKPGFVTVLVAGAGVRGVWRKAPFTPKVQFYGTPRAVSAILCMDCACEMYRHSALGSFTSERAARAMLGEHLPHLDLRNVSSFIRDDAGTAAIWRRETPA